MKLTLILIPFFCLILISCKKTATNKNSSIAYQLMTKNASQTVNRTYASTLSWTSGYAYVTEIKFEAEGECQIEGQSDIHKKFSAANPQKIDLFAPLSSLGKLTIGECNYRNSKFELELTPSGSNAALELKGTLDSKPIIFTISSPVEIEGIGGNKSVIGGSNYTSLTVLNLGLLTQGISAAELNAAIVDASGTIIISSTSNTSLYQKILNNLENIEEEEFH